MIHHDDRIHGATLTTSQDIWMVLYPEDELSAPRTWDPRVVNPRVCSIDSQLQDSCPPLGTILAGAPARANQRHEGDTPRRHRGLKILAL